MPFTTVGWFENVDQAALAAIAALPDSHIRVNGDDIIVPSLNQLIGYYAWGADLSQARLNSPSLRAMLPLDIEPFDSVDEPAAQPAVTMFPDNPLPLTVDEPLNFEAAEDNVAAGDMAAFIWLADGPIRPASGRMFTIRATGTATLTADRWTPVPLTFAQTLPAGEYAVVGLRARAAGLRAARFVFVDSRWRPGCIGVDDAEQYQDPIFRFGGLGVWGTFTHNAPPQIECMSLSADTAETFHIDLLKIR